MFGPTRPVRVGEPETKAWQSAARPPGIMGSSLVWIMSRNEARIVEAFGGFAVLLRITQAKLNALEQSCSYLSANSRTKSLSRGAAVYWGTCKRGRGRRVAKRGIILSGLDSHFFFTTL